MTDIALLQIVDSPASGPRLSINGFPGSLLVSARANHHDEALGLDGKLQAYALIHPFFLQARGNQLRADGPRQPASLPPAPLDLRVVRLAFQPGQPADTVFEGQELLRLAQPITAPAPGEPATYSLQGPFDWPGLPAWQWTQDPPIADTPAHQASLRAAVHATWTAVYRMGGGKVDAGWLAATRASSREFIQASELGGRPDQTLDTLAAVASTLKLPGDDSPEAFEAARQARSGTGTPAQAHEDDAPGRFIAKPRLPNGQLPPRLHLRPLSSYGELRLQLLGNGRLARLTDHQGSALLQFVSNYRDGARGAPGEVRYQADLWYRLNGQQWELAAVYPTGRIGGPRINPALGDVVKGLPY